MPLPPSAWSAKTTTQKAHRLTMCATYGPVMCLPGMSGYQCKPNGALAWVGETGWTMPAWAFTCARFCASGWAGVTLKSGWGCKPWSTQRSRLGVRCGMRSGTKSRAGHPAYLGQSPKKANASFVFTTPATSREAMAANAPTVAHFRKNSLKVSPTPGNTKQAIASARHTANARSKNLNKSMDMTLSQVRTPHGQ